MGMTSTGKPHGSASINVTPLIEVLLVLLILFMVIQPDTVHGPGALVPSPPPNRNAAPNPQTLVISIAMTSAGRVRYRLNEQEVGPACLDAELQRVASTRRDPVLFLQAEAGLDYKPVLAVLDAAHQAGFTSVGLLTPHAMR